MNQIVWESFRGEGSKEKMFEKIKGINIKSGIFEDETKLELFEGNFEGTNPVTIGQVYCLEGMVQGKVPLLEE